MKWLDSTAVSRFLGPPHHVHAFLIQGFSPESQGLRVACKRQQLSHLCNRFEGVRQLLQAGKDEGGRGGGGGSKKSHLHLKTGMCSVQLGRWLRHCSASCNCCPSWYQRLSASMWRCINSNMRPAIHLCLCLESG